MLMVLDSRSKVDTLDRSLPPTTQPPHPIPNCLLHRISGTNLSNWGRVRGYPFLYSSMRPPVPACFGHAIYPTSWSLLRVYQYVRYVHTSVQYNTADAYCERPTYKQGIQHLTFTTRDWLLRRFDIWCLLYTVDIGIHNSYQPLVQFELEAWNRTKISMDHIQDQCLPNVEDLRSNQSF